MRPLQRLASGVGVADRGRRIDAAHHGQVERIGTVGQRFLELPVDAEPPRGGQAARHRIVRCGPIGCDLTIAVEVGVHVPCPGRQASRVGSPRVERWPVGRHPGRGHRPGHLLRPLLTVTQQRATGTSRPKNVAPAVAGRINVLPDVAGTTSISRATTRMLRGPVRPAEICLWPDHAAPPRCFHRRFRAGTDQPPGGHYLWVALPSTRRRHPCRDGAEPGAGISAPRPANTHQRPAVVSCDDQRIRLDPGHGGERRYPPPHTAAHAMGGDPARRDRTVPVVVRGAPAASASAPGGSPIWGWSW